MFYVFERLRIIAPLIKKIIEMTGGDQGDDI